MSFRTRKKTNLIYTSTYINFFGTRKYNFRTRKFNFEPEIVFYNQKLFFRTRNCFLEPEIVFSTTKKLKIIQKFNRKNRI